MGKCHLVVDLGDGNKLHRWTLKEAAFMYIVRGISLTSRSFWGDEELFQYAFSVSPLTHLWQANASPSSLC